MVFGGRTGSADKQPADCPVRSSNPQMCTSNGNPTPKANSNLTAMVTLIKTEYWDRAGGGRNIGYEW